MWTFEKQEQKCSLYDSAEMKVKTIYELGYSFSLKEAVCKTAFSVMLPLDPPLVALLTVEGLLFHR